MQDQTSKQAAAQAAATVAESQYVAGGTAESGLNVVAGQGIRIEHTSSWTPSVASIATETAR